MALFEPLFEIAVRHDYYENDYSRDFRLLPTGETRKLLRGHGMLFRSTSTGLVVLSQVETNGTGDMKVSNPPYNDFRCRFMLVPKRAQFLNYTDLPFHKQGEELYYFNNLRANRDGNVKYLHDTGSRVAGGDRLPLENGGFRRVLSGPGEKRTARLVYPDANIAISREAPGVDGKFAFQFDLDRYPDGRARFESDGTAESFYAMGRPPRAGLFGIIEIYHGSAVPSPYRFIESGGTLNSQKYTLWFGRRGTFWRYEVIDRTGQNLTDPEISGNGFTFSEATPASYPPDRKRFVSDQPIELREEGVESLSLSRKVNSTRKSVLDSLPNPGIDSLKRDENDRSKFYSDFYLYM